jgi:type VI secretion system protein ImpG
VLQDASGERTEARSLYTVTGGRRASGACFIRLRAAPASGLAAATTSFLFGADLEGRLLADDSNVVTTRISSRIATFRPGYPSGRPAGTDDLGYIAGLATASALTKPTPTRRPARRRPQSGS